VKHEIHIWGLPKGETDRLYEQVLSTQCKTADEIERIKSRASQDGWHGFRVVNWDGSPPDFTKVLR
jgi:hypothetical protein